MKRHANLAFFIPHLGCPYQCVYCNQREITGEADNPSFEEVSAKCEAFLPSDGSRTEIAFFGGSFTAIPRDQMIGYLRAAFPFVEQRRAEGIRLSTRPDAIDGEVLDLLRQYGVTSVELGAQSMDDRILLRNGRGHDSASVRAAAQMIREHGFSLGLQMMVGLYGADDPMRDAQETAEAFVGMRPDTVRIYPTLVVDRTPLAALFREGKYHPLSVEEAVTIISGILPVFRSNGISVIRVGLHAEESLRREVLAGPFHPAFGELCESRIFREEIERTANGADHITVRCAPRLESQVRGQNRENITYFSARGIEIRVMPDAAVDGIEIEVP